MSNEEINKALDSKITELFEGLGIKLPDLPIVGKSDQVIEHDPD